MTSPHIQGRRHAGTAFLVNVFSNGPGGGNPAPIVVDASELDSEAMRLIAAKHGHESAFVLPGQGGCDYQFRFFVPNHEMEMCVHATVAAVTVLRDRGILTSDDLSVEPGCRAT